MTEHDLNQFRKIHFSLQVLADKMKLHGDNLKAVDVGWFLSVVENFDLIDDIFERASKAGALGSELFNFDFGHFDRSFELASVLARDLSEPAKAEIVFNDLIVRFRKPDSPYLRLLDHKRRISDLWADPVAREHKLSKQLVAADKLIGSLNAKIAKLEAITDEQTRRQTMVSQSDHFSKLACQYCRESSRWLWAISIIAGIVVIFGLFEVLWKHDEVQGTQGLYHIIAGRIIFITAAFYLLRICAQNYRQCQHNRSVNLHRSRALLAFERIIGAVEGQEAKGVILSKAADALFSHQSYGGHSEQPRGSDSTNIRVSLSADRSTPGST